MSYWGSTHEDLIAWYREELFPRSCGRRRVTSVPNCCRTERKGSLSEHHVLSQGWPVVNPSGVTEPMVGWKHTPILAVASHLLVLIRVFILFALKWNTGWTHVFIHLRMVSVLNDEAMCMHLSSCELMLLIDQAMCMHLSSCELMLLIDCLYALA